MAGRCASGVIQESSNHAAFPFRDRYRAVFVPSESNRLKLCVSSHYPPPKSLQRAFPASAAQTAIQIANDLSADEIAGSAVVRNTLILLRHTIERGGLPLTVT